jgi:hypothetical protein
MQRAAAGGDRADYRQSSECNPADAGAVYMRKGASFE